MKHLTAIAAYFRRFEHVNFQVQETKVYWLLLVFFILSLHMIRIKGRHFLDFWGLDDGFGANAPPSLSSIQWLGELSLFTCFFKPLAMLFGISELRNSKYWMEQLKERIAAKGQIVDDLLRRSACIPAAFTALFLSEPDGTLKRLLPRALRWLIDVANKSLLDMDTSKDVAVNNLSSNSEILLPSKIRDEGVVSTVHSFNVLRYAFNDTNLATDTSGFSTEALIIAIRSFSSPYWKSGTVHVKCIQRWFVA